MALINNDIPDFGGSEFKMQLLQLYKGTTLLKKYGYLIISLVMSSILINLMFATHHVVVHKMISLSTYNRTNDQFDNMFAPQQFDWLVDSSLWIVSYIITISSIGALFYFDNIRSKGMIVYEDLTDEMDWSIKRKELFHRPPLETRIVIRNFLKASDLPFTSGPNGRFFYLMLHVGILIATTVIKIF